MYSTEVYICYMMSQEISSNVSVYMNKSNRYKGENCYRETFF